MDPQPAVRLTIEIHHGGPAPSRHIQAHGRPDAPFDGWLQLLGALRDAIPGDTELHIDTNLPTRRGDEPDAPRAPVEHHPRSA